MLFVGDDYFGIDTFENSRGCTFLMRGIGYV
jgi:hypothetical protein